MRITVKVQVGEFSFHYEEKLSFIALLSLHWSQRKLETELVFEERLRLGDCFHTSMFPSFALYTKRFILIAESAVRLSIWWARHNAERKHNLP